MERHSHLTNQALVMASLNSYDNLGRVVFMQHYTGVSFAMYTSAFDAAGRMTSSGRTTAGAMPASESVSYVHDATGRCPDHSSRPHRRIIESAFICGHFPASYVSISAVSLGLAQRKRVFDLAHGRLVAKHRPRRHAPALGKRRHRVFLAMLLQ